jgi:hypothetical protein
MRPQWPEDGIIDINREEAVHRARFWMAHAPERRIYGPEEDQEERHLNQLLVGEIGEMVYSVIWGYKLPPLVAGPKPPVDFPDGCDVKASRFWDNPWLKERPTRGQKGGKPWPTFYCLVKVDRLECKGQIVGYCLPGLVERAPLKPWGYGDMLSVSGAQLPYHTKEEVLEELRQRKERRVS